MRYLIWLLWGIGAALFGRALQCFFFGIPGEGFLLAYYAAIAWVATYPILKSK